MSLANIETLIHEMSDYDLTEMSVIAAGYRLYFQGDVACARIMKDPEGISSVQFGAFDPLNNSDHLLLMLNGVAESTSVVCVSVGHDKTLCEFMTTMHSSNSIASIRRAIVKGCIKKWMEHNGFQRVLSMDDLYRRLLTRGFIDASISK